MRHRDQVLKQLVVMSRHLGLPEHDYAILGDGNTSARIDADTFWIKASGAQLRRIRPSAFVQVALAPILNMLKEKRMSDAEIKRCLSQAKVDSRHPHPSIETTLHALALTIGNAKFVGHTHPVPLNAILCSVHAREAIRGRMFSEEILYGGPAPAFVPYVDPGLPLTHRVQREIERHANKYGEPPRVILLQNHGMIALGQTPAEVENITAMTVKAARILLGTYALGGPRFLTPRDIARLSTRPDQQYRRKKANQ